jgi:hypothetical protein
MTSVATDFATFLISILRRRLSLFSIFGIPSLYVLAEVDARRPEKPATEIDCGVLEIRILTNPFCDAHARLLSGGSLRDAIYKLPMYLLDARRRRFFFTILVW